MSHAKLCLMLVLLSTNLRHAEEGDWEKLHDRKVQNQLAQLAYSAIVATVKDKGADLPKPTNTNIRIRAGCFVTIETKERNGTLTLRGCRGTLFPTQRSLADEIIRASIHACRDKRFRPLKVNELSRLIVSITVVQKLTPLDNIYALSPEHGLVVRRGEKVGVVLPYEGKDPLVRLEWAMRKAGLSKNENFEMWLMKAIRWRVSFVHSFLSG
ncbi:MAG: hypothetical protein RUDDFDWM_000644 [Candidatus Fervidibacterota bacterium]